MGGPKPRFGTHAFIWRSEWTATTARELITAAPEAERVFVEIARATCIWRDVVDDPERFVSDGLAFLRTGARRHGLAAGAGGA